MVNNIILSGILGVAFATCLVASNIAGEAQKEFKQTMAQINEMEPDKEKKDGFFKKYNIDELKGNYTSPTIDGEKTIINVPIINQYPELPIGCEITSAAAILNYLGFNVDKIYLQENFLEDSYNFHYNAENKRVGPDPREIFVGNPKNTGFGCFSTVIVDTLNKFFQANGSKNYAVDLIDADKETIEDLLDNGIPIEVWASRNMMPYKYTANNEWILETTGELFRWPGNAHALVLVGYDKQNYYFADCDNKTEIQSFKKQDFLLRWEQFGKQGVIVKLEDNKKS